MRKEVPSQAELCLPSEKETQDNLRDYRPVCQCGARCVPGKPPNGSPTTCGTPLPIRVLLLPGDEGDFSDPATITKFSLEKLEFDKFDDE